MTMTDLIILSVNVGDTSGQYQELLCAFVEKVQFSLSSIQLCQRSFVVSFVSVGGSTHGTTCIVCHLKRECCRCSGDTCMLTNLNCDLKTWLQRKQAAERKEGGSVDKHKIETAAKALKEKLGRSDTHSHS